VGYEFQRDVLLDNTEFLLTGYPALHVLLYGSRGSGKSSLVKGLNEYESSASLKSPNLTERSTSNCGTTASVPQKFIIFVDDLSFEEDDDL